MAREVRVGVEVVDQFPAWEADGYTKRSGLTSFDVRLWRDGAPSILPVTIAEIGASGEYAVRWTPDAAGVWLLEIGIPFNEDVWQGEYESLPNEAAFGAAIVEDASDVVFGLWLDLDGQRVLGLDSLAAVVRTTDGTLVVDLGVATVPTVDGVYEFREPVGTFPVNVAYVVGLTATQGSNIWRGNVGFAKV